MHHHLACTFQLEHLELAAPARMHGPAAFSAHGQQPAAAERYDEWWQIYLLIINPLKQRRRQIDLLINSYDHHPRLVCRRFSTHTGDSTGVEPTNSASSSSVPSTTSSIATGIACASRPSPFPPSINISPATAASG
jgi:hypothetical protein